MVQAVIFIAVFTIFYITFTMYCNGTWCFLTNRNKLVHYFITWRAPIHKIQILVVKTRINKLIRIVQFFVQTNYGGDFVPPEIRKVSFRRV